MPARRVYDLGRTWNAKVPRAAIAYLVNRQHVGTPSTEIAAMIRARCNAPGFTQQIINQSVAYALLLHARNGKLYQHVQGSI